MTTSSAPEPVPVPIRVVLPGDQEVVARLWSRHQVPGSWKYEVGLPAYRKALGTRWSLPSTGSGSALRTTWPVDGVSYDQVPTEYLPKPSLVD